MNNWKKLLMIVGGIAVVIVIIVAIVIVVVSATSQKLSCSSSQGDITIMYNDSTLTGYAANGITYDLDQQRSYAELVGIEKYLKEFTGWFEANTNGTCTR